MLKKFLIATFWFAFLGFFLYKIVPKYKYLIHDTYQHWGDKTTFDNGIFATHIFAGIIVYCTALLQFMPSIRNRHISFHRLMGRLYIVSSIFCIGTLYVMIPRSSCSACSPSQFIVTSLWFLFILLAFYFIKRAKVILHQRMMICSFVCAAYFVTIRVIDDFAMGIFYSISPNESIAFLTSDLFVWIVPLLFFSLYWFWKDKKQVV